jgi:hypothetical protein
MNGPLRLLAFVLAATLPGCDKAPAALTTDRLPNEKLAAMVAGPIGLVRRGDFLAGEAALAASIERTRAARGPRSVEEHDLLIGFAIGLHEMERRAESLAYMRQAIGAAKLAFGPRHPETAVALHSYATCSTRRAKVLRRPRQWQWSGKRSPSGARRLGRITRRRWRRSHTSPRSRCGMPPPAAIGVAREKSRR